MVVFPETREGQVCHNTEPYKCTGLLKNSTSRYNLGTHTHKEHSVLTKSRNNLDIQHTLTLPTKPKEPNKYTSSLIYQIFTNININYHCLSTPCMTWALTS